MRFIKIALIFLLVLSISACGKKTEISQDTPDTNTSNENQYIHQTLSKDIILTSDPNRGDWMTVDLSEAGLSHLTIGCVEDGYITKDNRTELKKTMVYIFCDYTVSNNMYHIPYLAVVLSDKVLIKDLSDGNEYNGSYYDTLYVADVDGDGTDEIIVQQTVGMSGGAGSYLSRIFKVNGDKIQEIFTSFLQDSSNADWSVWNTGFTSEFLNGYKLRISNNFTDYSTVVDISEKYAADFFDREGKGQSGLVISCDSFKEFTPKDVDHDGVYEIVCLQYVSLADHSDYIGDAKTVLKYNTKLQAFEAVQSEFIPKVYYRQECFTETSHENSKISIKYP